MGRFKQPASLISPVQRNHRGGAVIVNWTMSGLDATSKRCIPTRPSRTPSGGPVIARTIVPYGTTCRAGTASR